MILWFRIALTALSAAELLILHWALLAASGHGLSIGEAVLAFAVILVANRVLFPMARKRIRADGLAQAFSRSWIIGSIAALLAGLLLAIAFVVFGGSVWLLQLVLEIPEPVRTLVVAVGGGLAVTFGFGAILWGYLIGQRWVRVQRVELPLPGADASFPRIEIVQVTDLHIGPMLRAAKLRSYVDRINMLAPDVIVITGDIFDFDPQYIDEGVAELARLRAKHGVFAVLGNHDVYTGADDVAAALARGTDIRLLRDEWARIDVGEHAFCLAGIEDPGEGWREKVSDHAALDRLGAEAPRDIPRVLLAHRPSWFGHAARAGFPVVLAGHTHGGQLRLPLLRNWNVSRIIAHHTSGRFDVDGATLYVSQGLGVAGLPVRLNCPREISLIGFAAR